MNNLFQETKNRLLTLLRGKIAAGEERLPTDREIAASGTASYATVRLVMKQLEKDGYIRRLRGSGTYVAPGAAELLQKQSWKRLLLAAPQNSNNPRFGYFAWIAAELTALAAAREWTVERRITPTHEDCLQILSREADAVSAVIYLPPGAPFTPAQIGEFGKFTARPLIFMDVDLANLALCNITTDNYAGGRLAARWTLEHGFSRPAVLMCEPRVRNTLARLNGFCEALALRELTPQIIEGNVAAYTSRIEYAYETVKNFFAAGGRADLIFAISDAGAFGAVKAVNESRRKTTVLGFDGLAAGEDFALTTVAQPIKAMTAHAFSLLENWSPDECARQFMFAPAILER